MMDELMKMMAKKKSKGGEMSEDAMKAKMDVIQELLEMAQSAMGSKVKGGLDEMKKVSVMAPDTESLAAGLDTAKELTAGSDESSEEGSADEEASEAPKMEALEDMMGEEKPAESASDDGSSEENSSIFGKKKSKDAPKKKLFSMLD